MKFAYIDETGGKDQSDIFVMVALEIDHTKLNKYTKIFGTEFKNICNHHNGTPDEFKTKLFHRGARRWSKIPGDERKCFFSKLVAHVHECSKLYVHPVSFQKLANVDNVDNKLPDYTNKYWLPSALFILSHIQREHCDDKKNKGNCVIIIDDNKVEHTNMTELIYCPDPWLDDISFKLGFLAKKKKPKGWEIRRFDQIVNTPFAIKSQHASIVQVADLVAYVVRRYLELKTEKPEFEGEDVFFQGLFASIKPLIKKHSNLKKGTETYNYYKSIQPDGWEFNL